MKKIIILATLFLGTISYAQEHPWFIGGGINANISSNTLPNSIIWTAQWKLSPEIGQYVSPRFQIGGNLIVGEDLTRVTGKTLRSPEIGVGLFGRHLFGENNFHPFVGLKFGVSSYASKWNNFDDGMLQSYAVVNAGVLYDINPKFTIFGSLGTFGYTGTRYLNSNSSDEVMRDLGFNLNSIGSRFTFGLYYNFGKVKD